jgi:hypothetical protein
LQLAALLGAVAVPLVTVFAAELQQDVTESAPATPPTRHQPVPGVPPSATGDIDTP